MAGGFGILPQIIAIIAGQGGSGSVPSAAYTSIYGKTVWVSPDHERATDSRAGLSMYDQEHPYQTLGAACADIIAAGATLVCIRLASAYYDEDVTIPPLVDVFGEGDQCYITRLVFDSGICSLSNVQMYNDAGAGGAAPNLAPLRIEGGAQVFMRDIKAEDVFQDDNATQDGACLIVDGALSGARVYSSALACQSLDTSASTSTIAAVRLSGSGGPSVELYGCQCFGLASASGQSACGLDGTAATVASARVTATGSVFKGQLVGSPQTGIAAGVILSPGAEVKPALLTGGICQAIIAGAGLGNTSVAVPIYNAAPSTAQLCGVTALLSGASRLFAGANTNAGGITQLVDMSFPDLSTAPTRTGAAVGTFVCEGVLGTGVRFPAQPVAILSGRTIWVDGSSTQATDTRTGLSKYDRARPFATIDAALAAATAGDQVQVLAGGYFPAATLVIPADVSLVGAGLERVYIFAPSNTDVVTVEVGERASLSGVTVGVKDDASAAGVVVDVATFAAVAAVNVEGNINGNGQGVRTDGAGQVTISDLSQGLSTGSPLNVLSVILVAEGNICRVNGLVNDNNTGCSVGVVARNGSLYLTGARITGAAIDGVRVTDNAVAYIDGLVVIGATAALSLISAGAPGSSIAAVGVELVGNTYDVQVADTEARLSIQGIFDPEKIDAPGAWLTGPNYRGIATVPQADGANVALKSLSVGQSRAPAVAGLGAGLPFKKGVVALQNTNLTAGTWADVTPSIIDANSTINLFNALTADACFYLGADEPFNDFLLWFVSSSIASALLVEYWDGAAFVSMRNQQTSSQGREVARLGFTNGPVVCRCDLPASAPTTLNGINKYWLRVRLANTVLSVPTLRSARAIGAGLQVGVTVDGRCEYFGPQAALPVTPLQVRRNLQDIPTSNAAGASSTVQPNSATGVVSLGESLFADSMIDSVIWIVELPSNVDLSKPLRFIFRWVPTTAAAGTVRWFFDWSLFEDASLLNGTIPVQAGMLDSVAPGTIDQVVLETFDVSISPQAVVALSGAALVLRMRRDATAGNPADTFAGNAVLVAATMEGSRWM